ncbi:DUF943 family protein [Lonsdalea iberica]|uniref:DUF943 family protein n=1 Tax=Lonsdalea iberica TaxID=1082703 RepID=UPI0020CB2B46|nr:DUF943 family protein [Lonsdalea iberica]
MAGVIAAAAGGYLLWQYLTPVEIVAVHDGDIILVKHFPYSKNRQIAWWEANKDKIQVTYGIPYRRNDGSYDVFIQNFGKGYRVDQGTDEDTDLLCFDDMTVEANCIEKSPLMWVGWSQNTGQFYW